MATEKPEESVFKPPEDRGEATAFNNAYEVAQMSYPEDLFTPTGKYGGPNGGNYVIFYINVAEGSRLLKDPKVLTFDGEIPTRYRGDLLAKGIDAKSAIIGSTIVGAAGGVGVGTIMDFIKGKGSVKDVLKSAAVGAGIGLAASAVITAAAGGNMQRQQKRLKGAIALHVPNQLNIRYSTTWQDEETLAYQMGAQAFEAVKEVGQFILPGGESGDVKGAGSAVGGAATNVALTKTPAIAGALSASSGLAANPKKEQLFKNVNFRTFMFDYQFFPRSEGEAKKVKEIIKQFKLHMHPEFKDAGSFVYIYPSEFDVFYYHGGKENLNLHRHTSCVLTDMTVNYTPNGSFSTFEGGMPTQINITLTFLELGLLTKQQIQDGF